MPAYDYSAVADIYDAFCVFDGDFDYMRQAASSAGGRVLELMAGTGRVSLPLVRAGVELTCLDQSTAMLGVLRRKLQRAQVSADLVCGDVCAMPIGSPFELVILPFQGFTELIGSDHQQRLFNEVSRVLPPEGCFICTSHNPSARAQLVDGEWHVIGKFRDASGRELVLRLKTAFSDRPGVVEGTQEIDIFEPDGRLVESRSVDLEFSLTPVDTLLQLAEAAGLQARRILGDYAGNEYDELASPCLIVEFEKAPSSPHHRERRASFIELAQTASDNTDHLNPDRRRDS